MQSPEFVRAARVPTLTGRLWAALTLAVWVADASASQPAMVLGQSLAALGAVGGALAGAVAGWMRPGQVRFWVSFLIYLGVTCALASTWVGTLDIVPLTLVLGAAAGILPFAACFFLVRYVTIRVCAKLRTTAESKR